MPSCGLGTPRRSTNLGRRLLVSGVLLASACLPLEDAWEPFHCDDHPAPAVTGFTLLEPNTVVVLDAEAVVVSDTVRYYKYRSFQDTVLAAVHLDQPDYLPRVARFYLASQTPSGDFMVMSQDYGYHCAVSGSPTQPCRIYGFRTSLAHIDELPNYGDSCPPLADNAARRAPEPGWYRVAALAVEYVSGVCSGGELGTYQETLSCGWFPAAGLRPPTGMVWQDSFPVLWCITREDRATPACQAVLP